MSLLQLLQHITVDTNMEKEKENKIETSQSALATGSIAARFISQDVVDESKARREQEWKDAYARIGQEPPPEMSEQPNDGRTLFDRLEEQRALKQEEWDNRMKLSNQYRGLMSDELSFLEETAKEKATREKRTREEDNAELANYREALAKRQAAELAAAEPQAASESSPTEAPPRRVIGKAPRKDVKSLLKGVVVKRKPKDSTATDGKAKAAASSKPSGTTSGNSGGVVSALEHTGAKRSAEDELLVDKKRRV